VLQVAADSTRIDPECFRDEPLRSPRRPAPSLDPESQGKLGCMMPGESPAIFGDALRRLSASATFL